MTSQIAISPQMAGNTKSTMREESARYALMRRIAPALRHHMAGTLQPIGMISAILDRRLQAAEPDLNVLRENSKSISTLSRSAASACMNLITWVAPKENGVIPLHAGVEECVGMLATDLAFRGFSVTNSISTADISMPLTTLRTVFTAALIALTDTSRAPATVLLACEPAGDQTRIRITVTPEPNAALPEEARQYRALGLDDVQALADAENIALRYKETWVEMLFTSVQKDELIA
ncbi:MAG TPA: hypothetical protein VE934_13260 [Polaromonas sp.]|uniref:hypothetical protein n=1 Tax=Polaromonas sp. TaxID=1869339 RepID=UPI002D2FCE3D|nr:hypothetical protein [Polaromonas sp.]HYW57927.1 hypothetical protein [Polaromonas sp.]